MKKNLFAFVLVLASLLAGCSGVEYVESDQVEQNYIFQRYYIVYDAQKQLLTADVAFSVDNLSGSLVHLTSPSYLTCDDEKVVFENGTYFLSRDCSTAPKRISFCYVDNDGKEYVNRFKIKSIDTKVNEISFSREQSSTVSFEGAKANDTERFFIVLEQDGKENIEIEANDAKGHQLIFEADDVFAIPAGTYNAKLLRRYEGTNVCAADRGGIWTCESYSVSKKVTIK